VKHGEWAQRVQRILANHLPLCPGCLQPFDPVREGQVHCRPSCIVAEAQRKRRAGNLFGDGVENMSDNVVVKTTTEATGKPSRAVFTADYWLALAKLEDQVEVGELSAEDFDVQAAALLAQVTT
jgi:hypothetical protein